MAVVKLCAMENMQPLSEVLARLTALSSGQPVVARPVPLATRPATPPERAPVVREPSRPVMAEPPGLEPAKPAPVMIEGEVDLEKIKAVWPQIAALARTRRPSVGLAAVAAMPMSLANGRLVLGFPQALHKKRLENQDDRKVLEDCIAEVTSKRMTVELAIATPPSEPKTLPSPPKTAPAQPSASAPVAALRDESAHAEAMVRKALELFEGRIVGVEG
jgi:hypothetical protein